MVFCPSFFDSKDLQYNLPSSKETPGTLDIDEYHLALGVYMVALMHAMDDQCRYFNPLSACPSTLTYRNRW